MVVLRISYVKNIPTPDQVLIRYPRRCQSERMDCYIPEEGAYAISARICGRIQHVGLAATWALYGRMAREPWRSEESRVGTEWVSTGRSRWSRYHLKTKKKVGWMRRMNNKQ